MMFAIELWGTMCPAAQCYGAGLVLLAVAGLMTILAGCRHN